MTRTRTRLLAAAAAALAAGACAASAQAAPTVFAPERYERATPADRTFLRVVDGWANRLNTRNADWAACKTEVCNRDRIRHLSAVGDSAASSVRFRLRFGRYPLGPPATVCVRRTGAQFAHVGARAAAVGGALWEGQRRFDAAQDAYAASITRAAATARACQRALR